MDTTNAYDLIPIQEPNRQLFFIERCKEILNSKHNTLGRKLTYCVMTFGCQMNAHDSEKLKGILDEIGFIEQDDEEADFVVYNTCTIRENANTKLFGHLGHIKNMKKDNPDKIICLTGCMMQEPHNVELIRNKYKFVDIVFGIHNIYKLAEFTYQYYTGNIRVIEVLEKAERTVEALPTKRHFFFKSGVNITYGCNNFCTFCIVPHVRGRERSRLPREILEEIRVLASQGVKEVMLLGQNVNSYGERFDDTEIISDDDKANAATATFPELLKAVCRIDGIERVRFMTSHPKDLSDELIKVMAEEEKICNHIHLPVQSGSSTILKRMNRRYTKEHYMELITKLRDAIPDISITTDIIVGFPGESEDDFNDTIDIVKAARYDQAYTFIYSKRTGTPAATMDDQINPDVIKVRFQRLLDTVTEIAHERTNRFKGQIKKVLVEDINSQEDSYVTGRTEESITVHFAGSKDLIGKIVNVKLADCKGFYYMGEIAE